MKYTQIPNVQKPVAKLVYGAGGSAFWTGQNCNSLLDELLEMGVTTFDTARVYGKSESVLGKWIEDRGNREQLVIISKGGHPALFIKRLSENAIHKDITKSLQELKTDFIDIYFLHRDDIRRPAGEFVEMLNALHAEGKIGAFGGSNWTHKRIEEANEYAYKKNLQPFTVSSPYFGLADMKGDPFGNGAVSIAGHSNAKAREWYKQNGMAIFAFATLGSGFFSGRTHGAGDLKGWGRRAFATGENFERLRRVEELASKKNCTVPQLALSWVLSADVNAFAIVSSSTAARMRQNIAALDIELTKEEADWLDLK